MAPRWPNGITAVTDAGMTVAIRGIAAGGDGVGSLADGRTIFIPRTAPGDVVRVRRVMRHARYARGEVAELLESGPGRATPPCPHYLRDACGSCQVMHLDIATQNSVKRRIAGDALRRIGGLSVDDPPMHPAPEPLRYRNKVTFAVRSGRIGYHRLRRPDEIFEVNRCHLLAEDIHDLHQRVRRARAKLPPDVEHVVIRRDAGGGRHVMVRTTGQQAWSTAPAFHGELDTAVIVWWQPAGGVARAVAGSADPWPVTVFEQVHPAMATAVRRFAVDALGDINQLHAWDLYSGIGETTAMLRDRGATVESVERDARAVALAESLGPVGVVRHVGDVGAQVAKLSPPSVVVTNPPRAGMSPDAVHALARAGASRIVYISCDPATLARDLKLLDSSYTVRDVATFDQFPQTAHLETVAVLMPR